MRIVLILFFVVIIYSSPPLHAHLYSADCERPLKGQFKCDSVVINRETQQPVNCQKNNKALINCTINKGFYCKGSQNETRFVREVDCLYTNGYYFETALLLSIFLGMFGMDRFYLGYPAIGLLKLSTFGCLFIGQFIDIVLIALQIVKPADNSNYIIKYFGPRLTILKMDNDSYVYDSHDL